VDLEPLYESATRGVVDRVRRVVEKKMYLLKKILKSPCLKGVGGFLKGEEMLWEKVNHRIAETQTIMKN
jgi:hypothetical protein